MLAGTPVLGTLSENIDYINKKLKATINKKHRKIIRCSLAVGKVLIKSGSFVPTQKAVEEYKKAKSTANDQSHMLSGELWGAVSKHLNIIQIYI
jgi:hypothetical protein